MNLSRHDELVLGGILRFALRFDGLSDAERRTALGDAARELGLRSEETRLVDDDRASYRDAAVVVRSVSSDLDAFLERAEREIPDDDVLRALIDTADAPAFRSACVLAVECLGRHLGEGRERTLFLDWLRSAWRIRPRSDVA